LCPGIRTVDNFLSFIRSEEVSEDSKDAWITAGGQIQRMFVKNMRVFTPNPTSGATCEIQTRNWLVYDSIL
jgi:hypothetical protein